MTRSPHVSRTRLAAFEDASDIFNGAICAYCVAVAFDVRLLDEVASGQGKVCLVAFCQRQALRYECVRMVAKILSEADIVTWSQEDDCLEPARLFDQVYRTKGYYYWLFAGYGPMLQRAGQLFKDSAIRSVNNLRDKPAIARAASDYGLSNIDEAVRKLLAGKRFVRVADLGCGSGERLCQLLDDCIADEAVGIEIDETVVEQATRHLSSSGLGSRCSIVQADIRMLTPRDDFDKVDLVMCFFVGHELWPRDEAVRVFSQLRVVFPNTRRFLFADTFKSEGETLRHMPEFTLGFELTHSIMGYEIPRRADWLDLFQETSWQVAEQIDIGIPCSGIFDLRPIHSKAFGD